MRKLIFVTYASGSYKKNIGVNIFFAKLFMRLDECKVFTDIDLKKDRIYQENKAIFDANIGGGYWAWKPWAILQAILSAKEGDIVIYQDCGKGLKYKNFRYPKYIIDYVKASGSVPGISVPIYGTNKDWTHEKCFRLMNCDSSAYYDSPQVEASISAWEVNDLNINFIKEWLMYCLNIEVVGDQYDVDDKKIPHRYDQSILTNLVIKHKLNPLEANFNQMYITKSLSLVDLDLSKKFHDKIFTKIILFLIKVKNLFNFF